MAQIRDLQNKVNSSSVARVFYDPQSGSSSGALHVPDQTLTILSSRLCHAAILDFLEIRRIVQVLPQFKFKEFGIFISGFETLCFRDSKEREMKRESLNTPTQSPHFQSGILGNVLTQRNFKAGRSTSELNNVQDFDVRWEHARITVSEMPSDAILEGLYKSKITEFCSTSDSYGLVWPRSCSKQWNTELSAIKNCSETSQWSDDEKSKLQSQKMLWSEDHLPCVKKETNPALRGRWESVFSGKHTDNVPKETHVVSVMTLWPLETRAKGRDEKGDRLLPHPTQRQNRLTARNINLHRDQAMNRRNRETRVKFHAESIFGKKKKNDMWILASSRVSELRVWKRLCPWRQVPSPTCWGRRKAQQEA